MKSFFIATSMIVAALAPLSTSAQDAATETKVEGSKRWLPVTVEIRNIQKTTSISSKGSYRGSIEIELRIRNGNRPVERLAIHCQVKDEMGNTLNGFVNIIRQILDSNETRDTRMRITLKENDTFNNVVSTRCNIPTFLYIGAIDY